MTRISKIIIFLSSLAIVFMAANLVFAGKGYFLERNNNLYILDNLHINGYLAVENVASSAAGKMGDVLIGNYLLLDEAKNLYFCENTTANTDCNSKMLIWKPESLEVKKSNSYQLVANNLSAPNGTINFQPGLGKIVLTKYPVRIDANNGCFSNIKINNDYNCENNELKTDTIYFNTLSPLTSKSNLLISAQSIKFTEINLGPEKNINNQYICWKADKNASCKTAIAGDRYPGDRWSFRATGVGVTPYTNPATNTTLRTENEGMKLCCHLKVSF